MYINITKKYFYSILSLIALCFFNNPSLLLAQSEPTADYIVITESSTPKATVENLLDSIGATESDATKITSSGPVFGVNDLTATEAANLEQKPEVLLVQENQYRHTSLASALPVSEVNYLHSISGLTGNAGKGAPYAIAILDTGVMKTHEMLSGKVVYEICSSKNPTFTYNGSATATADPITNATSSCPGGATFLTGTVDSALPCTFSGQSNNCGHGTHVAGIAAGIANPTGSSLLSGIAPGANIVAAQVFTFYNDVSVCGTGAAPCISASDSDIIKALDHLYTRVTAGGNPDNIKALNLSLGGGLYSTETSCANANPAYEYYFNLFKIQNIPVFVASGNDGSSSGISAPACVPSAYAIGSTSDSDVRSSFSNTDFNTISLNSDFTSGTKKFNLDFFVPGESITSSFNNANNGYATQSGTSMASPYAAGIYTSIASLFNGTQAGYSSKTMTEIMSALKITGKKIYKTSSTVMYIPRMNAKRALNALKGVLPAASFATPSSSTLPFSTTVTFSDDIGFTCDTANCGESIIPATQTNSMISSLSCTLSVDTTSIACSYTVVQGGNATFTVKDSGQNSFSAVYTYAIGPALLSFTTTQADASTLGTGSILTLQANFDRQLDTGSTISVVLSNGATVTLSTITNNSGANTGMLSGTYTVGLSTSGPNTYTLNVQSISSASVIELGQPTSISASTTMPSLNISPAKTVTLDIKPPTISSLVLSSTNTNNPNLAITGEKIRFIVITDEPLRLTTSGVYTNISNYSYPNITSMTSSINLTVSGVNNSGLYTYTVDSPLLLSTDTGMVGLTYNFYDLYGNAVTGVNVKLGTDNSWLAVNPINAFITGGTTSNLTDANIISSQASLIASDSLFSVIGTKERITTLDPRFSYFTAVSTMTPTTPKPVTATKLGLTLPQNTSTDQVTILLNQNQVDTTTKNLAVIIPAGVSQTNQAISSTISQPIALAVTPALSSGTFMSGISIPTSNPLTFSGKIEVCLYNDPSKITTTNTSNIKIFTSADNTTWTEDASIGTDTYFTGSSLSLFCFKPNHLTSFALSNVTPASPAQNIGSQSSGNSSGNSSGGGGGNTNTNPVVTTIPKVTTPVVPIKTFCDYDIARPLSYGVYSKTNDVQIVKNALYDLGLYKGVINFNYDQNTENSVKALQKKMKLKETGIIDDTTWNALRFIKNCQITIPKKTSDITTPKSITSNILIVPKWKTTVFGKTANTQTHYAVLRLAELKFITADELKKITLKNKFYTLNTFAQIKLKAFQKSVGLKETGNINKLTWTKLTEVKTQATP